MSGIKEQVVDSRKTIHICNRFCFLKQSEQKSYLCFFNGAKHRGWCQSLCIYKLWQPKASHTLAAWQFPLIQNSR